MQIVTSWLDFLTKLIDDSNSYCLTLHEVCSPKKKSVDGPEFARRFVPVLALYLLQQYNSAFLHFLRAGQISFSATAEPANNNTNSTCLHPELL
jgi:hypothetical protein